MSRDGLVITGLGTVNAAGCGRRETASALRDGHQAWTEVDRSEGYHRSAGARLAGLVDPRDLSAWISGRKARRVSPPSKLALAAAKMALAEAGIEPGEEFDGRPTATVFSNGLGPSSITEKILMQIEKQGPLAVSPALFTESVSNAPAAQVALHCRAKGANVTVTQREAGPLIALARAATELSRGRAGYAVVATVDEVTPLLHAVLDRYRALARADSGGDEMPRPFDRRRNGFILAEGSTALIVETADTAELRGARVLARLTGSASAFDPSAPAFAWGRDPARLSPALSRFVDRRIGEIDAIVSGASGSRSGDRLEAMVLADVWGPRSLPPILTPKAALGAYGGAQLAAAILTLAGKPFGAAPGEFEPDPELSVAPHDGGPLSPSTVLVSSLATGGAAAWTLLAKGDGA